MSDHMRNFLRDFFKWLINNRPMEPSKLGIEYSTRGGICNNLSYYCERYVRCGDCIDLELELKSMFTSSGLDRYYPFNPRGWEEYFRELMDNTIYSNPRRITWLEGVVPK